METLIQIDVPSFDTYADFAWEGGADALNLWNDQEEFREAWKREREQLNSIDNGFRESTIRDRIRTILSTQLTKESPSWDMEKIDKEVECVHETFWKTYLSRTYVLPEVRACLDVIAARGLAMGIVSNFMVPGGIEELIGFHRLNRYFREVVVSCHVGWRKPSDYIFRTAIGVAETAPGEILFIGDSLEADYEGARAAGMEGLLYDREDKYPSINRRITSLLDVDCWLK